MTITCSTGGAAIRYTIDGTTPTNESTEYTAAITVSETTIIKAIAILGEESSSIATATYNFGTAYASLADLVAAGEPTEDGVVVKVTLKDEVITDFYTSSTSGNRNGVYLTVDEQEIEIYCQNVPTGWVDGGKLSGTLTCPWKLYDGTTWELCPEDWNDLTYVGPSFAIEIDDEMENGSIEIEDAQATATAGTEISFTVTPYEGYRMAAESLIVMDATGEEVEVSGNNPYTFTMPASDVTISAEFELIPTTQYTYSYSINGIIGQGISVPVGTEITLADGSDLNTEFSFAGWTTNASDVEHILAVGSYTIDDDVTFYAVYAREESCSNQCSGNYEKVTAQLTDWRGDYLIAYSDEVFMDGSLAGGTTGIGAANSSVAPETALTGNTITATWGDEHHVTIEAIDDADLTKGYVIKSHSTTTPYFYQTSNSNGMACTANKSTAAAYPITVSFNSDSDIDIALGGDATGAVLHYNATGTGHMFRFYKDGGQSPIYLYKKDAGAPGTTHYYTRVFLNETAEANITIGGPSIIPAGSTLNMGTYTLGNTNADNLIIKDGGQLIHHNAGVVATVQKNITAYADEEVNDGYYLIANPTERVQNDEYDVLDGATSGFDLYTFDPTEESEWRNKVGTVSRIPFERTVGYLFACATDRTMSFRGSILPAGTMDIDLVYAEEGDGIDFPGFNLLGNPYACNAYVNKPALRLDDTGSEFIAVVGAINPCEGFFVEARSDDRTVTISTEEPGTAPSSLSLTVSQNRGQAIDRAIVSFNDNSNLHKFMLNPAHTNISLAKGSESFAAVSTEAEGEVPVNFKAEKNGSYTITVNTENVDAEYLHLIDNMTGMDTDLLSTPSYTFEAKTSDYASRFKLVFGVNNTASENSDGNFAFMSDGNLVIDNIEGEATLQIADELGRIISTETVSGSYNKALNLKAGLCILNLNGMTQKIVVK